MSIPTVSDVLTRIGAIQQQIQELQSGSLLNSALGTSGGASVAPSGGAGSGAFAAQLAQAQQSAVGAGVTGSSFGSLAASALGTAGTLGAGGTPGLGTTGVGGAALGATGALDAGTALAAPAGGGPALGATGAALGATAVGGTGAGTAALPSSAATLLTSGQQQFAATLSADTGLNPAVVTSWLLAEESGGAAQTRQGAGNNDWLNIGYTDSGTYGSNDSVWSDPVTAAHATAAWLKGQDSIPGYGTASAGIQAILTTVGQPPAAQIQALQQSGWASGGYPSLGSIYASVSGGVA